MANSAYFPPTVTITEGRHTGEYIKSEASWARSRDNVTIAAGSGIVIPGQVLGRQKTGAAAAPVAGGANKGNGTIAGVALGAGAKVGTYTIDFTGAVGYQVINPYGQQLPAGAAGNSWGDGPAGPEISFSFAAGSTPMQASDSFAIAVAAGSEKLVPLVATATDGSQVAVAINYAYVDATLSDINAAVTARDTEVYGLRLTWDPSVSGTPGNLAAAIAELEAKGIIVR